MSPSDKDITHCFSRRHFLSPRRNPAERNIPSNVYYTTKQKLYLAIAGFALTRKSMHNALQPTAVLNSSKADLEIPCLHPSTAICLVEAPVLQPGTAASRHLPCTLIKNRHITSHLAFRTVRYMKNYLIVSFPILPIIHFLHSSTRQPFYLEPLSCLQCSRSSGRQPHFLARYCFLYSLFSNQYH